METTSKDLSRKGEITSYLAVSIFLFFGFWWLFHIPSVGKGGLFLAVGATLMPLFWEKVGIIGKMLWIGMLFILLFAEYRAIDKDQKDRQTDITNQQNNFSNLMTQNQKEFQEEVDRLSSISGGVADVRSGLTAATRQLIVEIDSGKPIPPELKLKITALDLADQIEDFVASLSRVNGIFVQRNIPEELTKFWNDQQADWDKNFQSQVNDVTNQLQAQHFMEKAQSINSDGCQWKPPKPEDTLTVRQICARTIREAAKKIP